MGEREREREREREKWAKIKIKLKTNYKMKEGENKSQQVKLVNGPYGKTNMWIIQIANVIKTNIQTNRVGGRNILCTFVSHHQVCIQWKRDVNKI